MIQIQSWICILDNLRISVVDIIYKYHYHGQNRGETFSYVILRQIGICQFKLFFPIKQFEKNFSNIVIFFLSIFYTFGFLESPYCEAPYREPAYCE